MNASPISPAKHCQHRSGWRLLLAAIILTAAIYSSGLSGGYLFDDYPNIVENPGVQPHNVSVPSLVRAALSSPSSEFKRPLSSLSFAANYLITGLDPYWMKLTNLIIHLLNGVLVFLLARSLIEIEAQKRLACRIETRSERIGMVAVLIATGWMLLPINLTGVLYVVQRMESMANLFVLLGLMGYIAGRRRMLGLTFPASYQPPPVSMEENGSGHIYIHGRDLLLCVFSIIVPTAAGIFAKETAVMLPLYALLIEWIVFGFQYGSEASTTAPPSLQVSMRRDRRIIALFLLVLVLPMTAGLAWLLPGVLKPETWATRNFTLTTRLLSETRIVVDYIAWTLLPTPHALSFYHDNFRISTGLLSPWTTLVSMLIIAGLVGLIIGMRKRRPLVALGVALFLGCQLLTGTIIPLELIYEHRNYFASFGLLLAVIPLLAAPSNTLGAVSAATPTRPFNEIESQESSSVLATASAISPMAALPMPLPRYALLLGLMLCWTVLTALTAYAWGNPLRLAEDLANRAPRSPRAQYELGRTYIIYSNYDPASPFTPLAYAPLERSAALPDSSILPEQALIFLNSRMHLPLKDAWWDSMIDKLKARKSTVQDESSLSALTQCMRENQCDLPRGRMTQAFLAALSHPEPSARLLAIYSDYAWNLLDEHELGARMIQEAVKASPSEPAYQITLIRMLAAQGQDAEARDALRKLTALNIGGQLNRDLSALRALPGLN